YAAGREWSPRIAARIILVMRHREGLGVLLNIGLPGPKGEVRDLPGNLLPRHLCVCDAAPADLHNEVGTIALHASQILRSRLGPVPRVRSRRAVLAPTPVGQRDMAPLVPWKFRNGTWQASRL